MKKTKENRPMPDPERSFSWSAMAAFEWSKEQWWNKYVLHKDCTYDSIENGTVAFCAVENFADPECPVVKKTIELAFGSMIDLKIQKDPKFLPELPRYELLQEKLKAEFNGITLINVPDALRYLPTPGVRDYKTGRRAWDQKRADETGQLTMACLLLWLTKDIRPDDVDLHIDWLPTHIKNGKVEFVEDFKIHTFRTKRTMREVLKFGQHIVNTHNAMYEYAMNRPILDTHSYAEW